MDWARYSCHSSEPYMTPACNAVDFGLKMPGFDPEDQSPCDFTWFDPTSQHGHSGPTCMFSDAEGLAFYGSQTFYNIAGNYNVQVYECTPISSDTNKGPKTSETESETYARLLLSKRNGYPIWYPPPTTSSPKEYREGGARIGDVGIITPHGQFDFLFNIIAGENDPINHRGVPDGFVPISPPAGGWEIEAYNWSNGRNLLAGSAEVVDNPMNSIHSSSIQYTFKCMAHEGAMLALPEGAVQEDLVNHGNFNAYAAEHAINWYKYMCQHRANATNGSLYLVTGTDKTHAWGNASFSGVATSNGFSLHFASADLTANGRKRSYSWSQSRSATTQEGPPIRSSNRQRQNQCTFIRGYKITLAETIWKGLGQATGQRRNGLISLVARVPGWNRYFMLSTWPGFSGLENPYNDLAQSSTRRVSGVVSPVVLESPTFHPSNVINKWLLSKEFDTLPDTQGLLEHVEKKFEVKIENGHLSAEAKQYTGKEAESEVLVVELPQRSSTQTRSFRFSKSRQRLFKIFISFFLNRNREMDRADLSAAIEKLTRDIEKRKSEISRIKAQEAQYMRVVIRYAVLLWLGYALLSYSGVMLLRQGRRLQELPSQPLLVPLAFEPFVCIVLLGAIRGYYACRVIAEEKRLGSFTAKLQHKSATLNEMKQTSSLDFEVNIIATDHTG